METEYSVYLGQEQKNGFTGFLSEQNFFCVVEIFDGFTNEQGEQLMSALTEVGTAQFDSLGGFDASVSGILKRLNIPMDTSIALGYRKNNSLYLKTVGTGEIYISRGKSFEMIVKGDNIAAGKFHSKDIFTFTTSFFTESLKGIAHTKTFLHKHLTIRDFPEHIKQTIGTEDDTGAVALFIAFGSHAEIGQEDVIQKENLVTKLGGLVQSGIKSILSMDKRKKIIIGLILLICIGLFGWNVNRGVTENGGIRIGQGQSYDEKKLLIETAIEKAGTKTDAISEGLQLVQEANGNLLTLKKTAQNDKKEELASLEKKLKDIESSLLKREFKDAPEHYDFGFEEKGATGTRMYAFEDKAFVLNPEGKVYILALEKKALEKRKLLGKVSANSLIAGYEKNAFVLNPTEGIVRIDEDGKSKVVIPKETQWSDIVSMQVYNGNVYLLDGGNNALYKYSVTTDGYGDRVSYFKGSYNDMDKSSTFAIDISVYVSNSDTVTKYTAGLRDDFKLTIPGENVTVSKVITHGDQKDLYIWDKKNSVIYITTREGVYMRQVTSKLLGQASDVEVYNNKAYLLKGAKLYRIEL